LVKNLTNPSETVFFDFGDGTTSDQEQITHQYAVDSTYAVTLIGKKEFCVYDQQIRVPIYQLFVPNVFTPDATPNLNDTFEIKYHDNPITLSNLKVSLAVYNQWGAPVFQASDYQNNWTGSNVVSGIYYYEAIIKDEATCKGWVHVMK
jgi:hypothetical protein